MITPDLFSDIPKSPTKDEWLDRARDLARRIAEERGSVCADDIHDVLSIPSGVDRRTMGAVFEGMRWVGFTKSRRKACHYRPISRFAIAREA